MNRWIRVCWPPLWALVAVLTIYAAIHAAFWCLDWIVGFPVFSAQEKEPLAGIAGFYGFVYACFRLVAFHPALRGDYRMWLSGTPWTSQRPLPLGPIHLVPQDVLLLAIIVAIGWPNLGWRSLTVVQAFLFAYLVGLGFVCSFTGARGWAYALGFSMGFMALFALDPVPFVVAAAVSYALALLGTRAALARFPWSAPVPAFLVRKDLGWPYDRLGPSRALPSIRLPDALLTGAVAGWLFFAVGYNFGNLPDAQSGRFVLFLLFCIPAAAFRTMFYCSGYGPPISLAGRIVHGQWIIPAYDRVFIAPLCAVLVAVAAGLAYAVSGVDSRVTVPIAFTLVWWILLGMGPSLREWRLTGNHRIVPGVPSKEYAR